MTLIAVYNSMDVGRCDAKCYNATSDECTCICGGANHGAGKQQAVENTRELVDTWIDDWKDKHPGQEFNFRKNERVQQLSLF